MMHTLVISYQSTTSIKKINFLLFVMYPVCAPAPAKRIIVIATRAQRATHARSLLSYSCGRSLHCKVEDTEKMVRTDLSLHSQYWTPSSRCAPSYRRPSVTTNVTLAYNNSGTGLCCSLRCQKKRKESFLISKKEKNLSQSKTSGGLPSVTPLLPQRQQARRLTKMQGCYRPNIHCRYRYNNNLTQCSPRLPDSDAQCNVINFRTSMNSNNQTDTRCRLHQLTDDSFKLQKQNEANEANMKLEEESGHDNAHKALGNSCTTYKP